MSDRTYTALRWASVTKSDSAYVTPTPTALFVGGAGDIALEGDDGISVVFTVTAGAIIPCQPLRVLSTGTDATNIVALYN